MLHDIIAIISNARARAAGRRPIIVGIDGPSGAGKSTLARRIEEALKDVSIVHKDDFYSDAPEQLLSTLSPAEGYSSYFDWQRLREQVLLPLSSGHHSTYQCFDWNKKVLGEWRSVPLTTEVAIVEGVYALRPELRDFYNLKILVQTGDEIRASRLIARGENSKEWVNRWSTAEAFYFENHFSSEQVIFVDGQGA